MLTLWGKIIKNEILVRSETVTTDKENMQDALLEGIEHFSKAFDMEAPMWHTLHTKQMGLFHKAIFKPDDFIDAVNFDRFELQILEND
jgi:hypothetical protein